jgi:putative MATE family efflux protein
MFKKNKILLEEKISKLLLRQSLPAAVGMLVMTLYNIVDTIFIGRGVGTIGLTAVALSFPIMMMIGAVAQSFGVGFSSIISRSLGAHNHEKAHQALGSFLVLSFLTGLFFSGIFGLFLKNIFIFFGASVSVLPFAMEYARIIVFGSIFFIFTAGGNNIIRSIGEARIAMQAMIISALVNVTLDYFFIFILNMGMAGAAWATVIAWVFGAFYIFYYIFIGSANFKLKLNHFVLRIKIIKEGLSIGLSSFARQISTSLMSVILNKSLAFYGSDLAIAAFGIIMRIAMLILMPVFGIVQGMQPIVGSNYGAKQIKRVKEVTILAIKVSSIFCFFAFLFVFVFPKQLIGIFTSDNDLLTYSMRALRIFILVFPLIGFQSIAGGFYQSLGRAKPALFISMLRQIVILIPLMIILPLFFGLNGLYYSFPIADTVAVIITFFVFKYSYKRL